MGASTRLRSQDTARLFALIAEILDTADDPRPSATLLVRSLCEVFRAELCESGCVALPADLPPSDGLPSHGLWRSTPSWGFGAVCTFGGSNGSSAEHGGPIDPLVDHLLRLTAKSPSICATDIASCVLGLAAWRVTPFFVASVEPFELDDSMASVLINAIAPGLHGALVVRRRAGEPPFDEHDRALLDTFHAGFGPVMWKRILLPASEAIVTQQSSTTPLNDDHLASQLSPMQRKVLPMLLEGLTEREIASRLHRSKFTIHDHAKAIYSLLGVRSRIELILKLHTAGARSPRTLAYGSDTLLAE